MGEITCYKLSEFAAEDVSDIYDYTATQHGRDQAVRYLTDLEACLETLVGHPEMGRERVEIRHGLRSLIFEHHVIFYRLHDDYVRIVRVLHKSCDMPRFLRDVAEF